MTGEEEVAKLERSIEEFMQAAREGRNYNFRHVGAPRRDYARHTKRIEDWARKQLWST